MAEDPERKRDREFLERVIDERDRIYEARYKALEKLIDERDRLYDSRFKASEIAVNAALAAQEKGTSNAFMASEKAIVKAEQAQKDYNERSNEFRGQLDDQAKTLMPRPETLAMFRAIEEKIASAQEGNTKEFASLRATRSEGVGEKFARRDLTEQAKWLIGILLGIAGLITGYLIHK